MTTTPTAFPELPDLDKLEAYATSSKSGDWQATEAMLNMLDEDDVLALVAAARRAQPEGEAPQADESSEPLDVEFKQLADTILQATTNGTRLEALRGMAVLFDKQAALHAPGVTLSPLCGAQHAESGKEACVDQTRFYGDARGGDCVRASIATLLGIALDSVPDFPMTNSVEHWDAVDEFLDARGLKRQLMASNITLEVPYLASGKSSRGCSHMVVMCNGKLFHDPHPSREGLISVDYVHLVMPVSLAAQQAAAPVDCSGTPSSCPDNEGYGCHCSAPGTPEAPKKLAHGHRDDYFLMANARRIANYPISSIRRMQNWALAMELFSTGSHSAHQICIDAGIDPDSYKVERSAQLDGGQEGSESNG